MQPCQRVLPYLLANGVNYIDLASDLSKVNRRLYRQGMQYAVSKIDFHYHDNPDTIPAIQLCAGVAGDTWVVHNAWTKAKAHWIAQQRRARRLIGQSAKPKWEDFKVYLDDAHRAAGTLAALAGDGGAVGAGEWDYSKIITEADDASVIEWYLHLIGGDLSGDKGLILAYQESRATVQSTDPELPAEYSNNLYSAMAQDQDAVSDEVAQNMEDENDEPPYDLDDYPGTDTNSDSVWPAQCGRAAQSLAGRLDPFVVQSGLLSLTLLGIQPDGSNGNAGATYAYVHLAPGGYQGVAAIPMGQ